MGNRTFLYTTDRLLDPGHPEADAPQALAGVAEANNALPPLWRVLLGAAVPGPAQDAQQVFLPSLCGGIYAPRAAAEARMFRLLDFIADDPELPDPSAFREQIAALRVALAEVEGAAYCADLNEWYALESDGRTSPEAWLDAFAADCAQRWEKAERAMEAENHGAVVTLYEFEPDAAAGMLGFDCWTILDWTDEDESGDVDLGAGLERFVENGKVGVYNRYTEQVTVAAILDEVYCYEEGAAVAVLDGRYGYLDMDGNWLVRPVYDDAFDFSAGMGQVERDGLSGYVNAAGEEIVAPRFLPGSSAFVAAGFAPVQLSEGFGVIDRTGTLVVPAIYSEIEWIDSLDAWQARRDGDEACVVLHADGRHWCAGRFDSVYGLSAGGDAVVERDGKLGTWQRGGGPGLPLELDDIDELATPGDAQRARLYVGSLRSGAKARKGVYRADGEPLVPAEFSRIESINVARRGEGALAESAGDYFLVKRHGGGAHGVWSRAANALILPFEHRAIHAVATARGVFLVALHKDGGWVVADADGRAINAHRYDWLVSPGYADGDAWTMPLVLSDLAQAWDLDKPVLAGRGDASCYLSSKGVEEGEVDYLLRATREAEPIVAPRGMLRRLFAREMDDTRHCIEGAGDAESCARLGDIYALGMGVPVDAAAALRWYATAARGGHEGARFQYAYFLATGTGCDADPAAAREQLFALGEDNVHALNLLGYLYEHGLGGEADPAQARACYERAARGDKYGLAEAQLKAGNCWKLGIGGPVDKDKALGFIELAAARTAYRTEVFPEATWAAAQLNAELALEAHEAGDRKLHGRRLKRAIRYYNELLEQGDHGGLLGLARCYLGDYGGKADPAKGRAYLDQAAGTDVADLARSIRREHRLG